MNETFPAFPSPQQIKHVQTLPVTKTFDPKAEGENTSLSFTSSTGCLDRNSSCSQVPAGKVITVGTESKTQGRLKPQTTLDGQKAVSGTLSKPLPSHRPELLRELIRRTSGL